MKKQIGLIAAIAIGIGGMVGGGIFAVLGLAVDLSKGGTPLAFLIAGIIALITSYSYVKLSLAYPNNNGGTVTFINQGFGKSIFSGGMNNLLWFSYIIMLALYASAFGSYGANLFHLAKGGLNFHIFASAVIIISTFINYYSVKIVGKTESYAVSLKMIILLAFVVIGGYGLSQSHYLAQLLPTHWESPLKLLTGGMVIFVAYEGFELIANAAPNIKNRKKNIPRAFYYSVSLVILLYISIAAVTVGSLPFSSIASAQDYVLAEAAKPMLGNLGFIIISIAALLSTFSAINATLYGGSKVSRNIAEDDELPHQLTGQLWNKPIGLAITAIAALLATNFLKLESISTAGSIGFLIIFAIVNLSAFKLRRKIESNYIFPFLGFLLSLVAMLVLVWQQYISNRTGVLVEISLIIFCLLIELIYKKLDQRK